MHDRSARRTLAAGLAAPFLALAIAGSALAAGDHFNEKFEFEDVTFPDATTGTIYAGSKLNNQGDQFTNCGYFSEAGAFLGQFGSGDFSSTDPDAVLAFCLDHYDERS